MPIPKLFLAINQTNQLQFTLYLRYPVSLYHDFKIMFPLELQPSYKEICPVPLWCHFTHAWAPYVPQLLKTILGTPPCYGEVHPPWLLSSKLVTFVSQQRLNSNLEPYFTKNSGTREGKKACPVFKGLQAVCSVSQASSHLMDLDLPVTLRLSRDQSPSESRPSQLPEVQKGDPFPYSEYCLLPFHFPRLNILFSSRLAWKYSFPLEKTPSRKNYIRKSVRHTKCLVELFYYRHSLPLVLGSLLWSSGKQRLYTQNKKRPQFEAKHPQNQTGLEILERTQPPTPALTQPPLPNPHPDNCVSQTEVWLHLPPKFMLSNRTLNFSVSNICVQVNTDFTFPSRTVGEYLIYIFVNKWQTQVVFPDQKQQFASEVNSCHYPQRLEIACSFKCFPSFPSY